jgi:hypothetical protein
MRNAVRLSLLPLLLLLAPLACGQGQGTVTSTGFGRSLAAGPPPMACTMTVQPIRGMLASGEVAPYSATQETSHTQTGADGTVFSSKLRTEKIWRDSQNLTRTERPFCMTMRETTEPPTYVEIRDPVAGYAYILDAATHTAHRFALKVRERGTPAATAKPAEMATVATAPMPSGVAAPNPKAASESLGEQVMEGVPVEGTRTTETIPTGQMDNDRPFNIVHELWISPTLHVVVYSQTSDPRNGESIARLKDIQLGVPDPSLFEPPADYTLVDDGEAVKLTLATPSANPAPAQQ